jgi:hypothetical protein
MLSMMTTEEHENARGGVLHMKIDLPLKLKLMRIAREQNRSLSNLVETVLRAYARQSEEAPS